MLLFVRRICGVGELSKRRAGLIPAGSDPDPSLGFPGIVPRRPTLAVRGMFFMVKAQFGQTENVPWAADAD